MLDGILYRGMGLYNNRSMYIIKFAYTYTYLRENNFMFYDMQHGGTWQWASGIYSSKKHSNAARMGTVLMV